MKGTVPNPQEKPESLTQRETSKVRLQSPKRKRETELQTQWKTVQKVACLRFGNSNTEEMPFQIFNFDLIVWSPNSKLTREALKH